ncbi:MAG: helix-turn-helix domain-containing protein [Agrococcus casei]|uniref:helix-turn-helix domain-containing protein n=1 Tax=Agrococcus casei TaxID=343512 RepID=UPI003F9CE3BC
MSDLRARRQAAGLTQAELAARAGTARPNIAAYESGAKVPSPEVLARLLEAMRPRPSDALAGNESAVSELARKFGAERLRVFGSTAKGIDTPGSDLDLVVDLSPGTSFYSLVEMEDALSDLLGVSVDIISEPSATDEIREHARDLELPTSAA